MPDFSSLAWKAAPCSEIAVSIYYEPCELALGWAREHFLICLLAFIECRGHGVGLSSYGLLASIQNVLVGRPHVLHAGFDVFHAVRRF
jgi:hypothetical protein